jgi:hypothetical protein
MAASPFTGLLEPTTSQPGATVLEFDRTRDPRSNELTHAVARGPNVPRRLRRGLAPIETSTLLQKEAQVDRHNGRLVLVQTESQDPPGVASQKRCK